MYENSELNVFKNLNFFTEISTNWPDDLFEINVYKTLELCLYSLLTIVQWTNTISVTSKLGKFFPFLSFVILFLVLPSNFIVSDIKHLR